MIKQKIKQFFEKTKQNRQTSKKSTQEHTDADTQHENWQSSVTPDARGHQMPEDTRC